MKTRTCLLILWGLLLLAVSEFPALATYNPQTGRWLSRDPIGERGGLNTFVVARNDGLNSFDVLGLSYPIQCPKCCCANNIDVEVANGGAAMLVPWKLGITRYQHDFWALFTTSAVKHWKKGDCWWQWHEINDPSSTSNAGSLPLGPPYPGMQQTDTGWISPGASHLQSDTPGIPIAYKGTPLTGFRLLYIRLTLMSAPDCPCPSPRVKQVQITQRLQLNAGVPVLAGEQFTVSPVF